MISKLIHLKKFWTGKKVFITGHTGFKGSWMVIFLNLLGAKIYGYSLNNRFNSFLFKKAKVHNLLKKNIYNDIRNYKKIKKAIVNINPDFLIHFAAQTLVTKSYSDPKETFDVNVMGTVNILNVLNNIKKKIITLIVTTDKVYENINYRKFFDEKSTLGGEQDPYSSSKTCADLITQSYNFSFFKKKNFLAIVRTGNVIGGGDNAAFRLIPDYYRCLKNKTKLKLRYPFAVRPWQHVMEPLYGYLILLESLYKKKIKNNNSNLWNFGPKKTSTGTVLKVVKILNSFRTRSVNFYFDKNKNKNYESKLLMLNSLKAKNILSWSCIFNLEESLALVNEWYKNFFDKKKPLDICREQIVIYLKKIN
jgi:CDP-glucose 4,6-dehydratase